MGNLTIDCGSMPGIKKIYFSHIKDINSIQFTKQDTVSIELKTGKQWREIESLEIKAESSYDNKFSNSVEAKLPNTNHISEFSTGNINKGRYVVKFIDYEDNTLICGFPEPMRLKTSISYPASAAEKNSITLTFINESEKSFLFLE